jgi:hypothetical protein
MICTYFDISIRFFHADSTGEYVSDALCQVLTEQGTLAQFSYPCVHAQNTVAKCKHHHLLGTARALIIASFVVTHFLVGAVSNVTYLINI